MRKFLFVLASTAILAMTNTAKAQVYWVFPGYAFPAYVFSGFVAPGFVAPGFVFPRYFFPRFAFPRYVFPVYVVPTYIAPGYIAPGYQDWQQREYYEKLRCPIGISTDTRNIGECAIGMSEETCRRRGQRYNPPRQN